MGFEVIDGDHNICNIGLGLGLNTTYDQSEFKSHAHEKGLLTRRLKLEPSILTLGFSSDSSIIKRSSPSVIKRENKELLLVVGYHEEEMEVEKVVDSSSTRVLVSDEDDEGGGARKKLRLTKEQSSLLEDNFKENSTLNPKQKQALAKQLNLRPRQVEVWFQNRRARTKLKQTEVDCEFLKKCCETLTEENRRLHKELRELKALKSSQPPSMYMQLPAAATLTICPSCHCEGLAGAGDSTDGHTKNSLPNKPHSLYNPFKQQHPSAAC